MSSYLVVRSTYCDTARRIVAELFNEFNSGTHGAAGKFALAQLGALKRRVEDAVHFVHAIAFGVEKA